MTEAVAVTERPILFSGSMVLAILEDRKTKTRRVVKDIPTDCDRITPIKGFPDVFYVDCLNSECGDIACPYGKPGDRLWVRETHWRYGKWRKNGLTASGRQRWRFIATRGHNEDREPGQYVHFEAPSIKPEREELGWHKRPSIFLPRKFARITLEITGVRVERLQGIGEVDAEAEGAEPLFLADLRPDGELRPGPSIAYRAGFLDLWESINGKRPGRAWADNPWVWVIEFRRII